MNECYFLDCEGNGSPADYPFVNLISNSVETKNVVSDNIDIKTLSVWNGSVYVLQSLGSSVYTANEYATGPSYVPTFALANQYALIKGAFGGSGISSLVPGLYRIEYVLALNLTLSGAVDFYCQFGASAIPTASLSLSPGNLLLRFNVWFQILSGTATTCSIIYYGDLENVTVQTQKILGSTLNITGITGGIISPDFYIRSSQAPTSWSGSRVWYLMNRSA